VSHHDVWPPVMRWGVWLVLEATATGHPPSVWP
jgi:hypothetical protein